MNRFTGRKTALAGPAAGDLVVPAASNASMFQQSRTSVANSHVKTTKTLAKIHVGNKPVDPS